MLVIPIKIDATQPEFEFAQVYLKQQEDALKAFNESWMNLARSISSFMPKDFSVNNIFGDEDIYHEPIDPKYCFPMTIVCGERNQYEFSFSRAIDEASWGFPVKYPVECRDYAT